MKLHAIAAALGLVACSSSSAAPTHTCADVENHVNALYAKLTYHERQAFLVQTMDVTHNCVASKFDDKQRSCLVAAASVAATFACLGRPVPAVEIPDVVKQLADRKGPQIATPFSKLADLTPQTTNGEFLRRYDVLCAKTATIAAWCEFRAERYPTAIYRVQRIPTEAAEAQWPLGAIRITVSTAGVLETLTAGWGPPIVVAEVAYWLDPKTGVRGSLQKAQMPNDPKDMVDIEIEYYTPLAAFVKTELTRWLGAAGAKVEKQIANRLYGDVAILHPVETSTKSRIKFGQPMDGKVPAKVTSYTVTLAGLDPAVIAKALETQFGPPRKGVYGGKAQVTLRGTTITVGATSN